MPRSLWTHVFTLVAGAVCGALVVGVGSEPAASPAPDPSVSAGPPSAAVLRELPVPEATSDGRPMPRATTDCRDEVAKAEAWCEELVVQTGGALPAPWPERLETSFTPETLTVEVAEALEDCDAGARWHALDCDEFPCALVVSGLDAPRCDALPAGARVVRGGPPERPVTGVFWYPEDARTESAERFTRRERMRLDHLAARRDAR